MTDSPRAPALFREVELGPGIRGRMFLHSMPGRSLPGRSIPGYVESLDDTWAEIERLGVSSIVCLVPIEEIRERSPQYARALEEGKTPCAVLRFPIRDFSGPDDDGAFRDRAVEAAGALRGGARILIHCNAGIGRTGMFAAATLIALGVPEHEARRRVRAAGSGPELPEQIEVLRRIALLLTSRDSDNTT